MFSPSNFDPLMFVLLPRIWALPLAAAHLGRSRHPSGHRSPTASRNFLNSGFGLQRPRRNGLPVLPGVTAPAPDSAHAPDDAIPMPGLPLKIETVVLS